MGLQQLTKDYLQFTKKDRVASIIVLVLVGGVFIIPKLLPPSSSSAIVPNAFLKDATDTLQARSNQPQNFYPEERERNSYQYEPSEGSGYTKGELFVFNPNTLAAEGWQRLGLSARTTKTILNYRNKGGKFYKPEDLKKIWGLPQGFYERVASYIQLEKQTTTYKPAYTPAAPYEKRERNFSIPDVNSADTSALIALPGIGSKLAARIATFRDKLGGFYSVNQIAETYGLPDSTFEKIKPFLQINTASVKKLNINTVTKDELKVHPYIKWNLANAIVEYRNQHGRYNSLEELKRIVLIDEATFEKIVPYLSL